MSLAGVFEAEEQRKDERDYVLSVSAGGRVESTAELSKPPAAPPRSIPRALQTAPPAGATAAAPPLCTCEHEGEGPEGAAAPAAEGILAEMQRGRLAGADFAQDVESRPEAPGAEAYAATPIEEFGAAILRGLGWSEGAPIGLHSKAPVPVYEVRPRAGGRLGLGADPKTVELQARVKALARKGVDVAAPKGEGAAGAQEAREAPLPARGTLASVADGQEEGHVGVVVDGEAGQVLLRLYNDDPRVLGAREVWVAAGDLSLMDAERLPRDNPLRRFWRALNADDTFMKAATFAQQRAKAEEKDRLSRPQQQQQPAGAQGRERGAEPAQKKPRVEAPPSKRRRLWVEPNLVVRIVSKRVYGGRYYRQKARVVDVADEDNCVLETLEGQRVLEGVPVSALETVIPPSGQAVLVLGGDRRGASARLMERRVLPGGGEDDVVAVVQVHSDLDVLQLPLDDVCHYVGEHKMI